MSTKPVFAIIGTTGVGKSKLSVELAKAIGGEIINADSMQVYRGLDLVTNVIPVEERQGIPHHLLGIIEWDQEYSVIDFSRDALQKIDQIHSRNAYPILVGGTHYYIQSSLWKNMLIADGSKRPHPNLSDHVRLLVESCLTGPDAGVDANHDAKMYEILCQIDPVMGKRWHSNDGRKVRRSLEVYYTTGRQHSVWLEEQRNCNLQDQSTPNLRYPVCLFWVYADSNILGPRLDDRVDHMIKEGMFEELKNLMKLWRRKTVGTEHFQPDYTRGVFQAIGFKEFHDYLVSPLSSIHLEQLKESGVQAMKIATRQYARRQTHWIRNRLASRVFDEKKRGGRFGFYCLNATDLCQWNMNVSQAAIDIANRFLDPASEPSEPSQLLENLIPKINPQSSISVHEWEKYTCDVCVDAKGQPRVSNGLSEWKAHTQSRIHRKRLEYIKNDLGAWKRRLQVPHSDSYKDNDSGSEDDIGLANIESEMSSMQQVDLN